jgi:hypothetical protein
MNSVSWSSAPANPPVGLVEFQELYEGHAIGSADM